MAGTPETGPLFPPCDLGQFHRAAENIPDAAIRVSSIPDLLSLCLHHPPDPGYETKKALDFRPGDFALDLLDAEELDRLNRFKVLKKQVEWTCGRLAAKSLARETLMPEKALRDIRILYRSQGAPYLEGMETFCLSLSHSGGLTAAALSLAPGQVLGIDIEAIGPMPDHSFLTTAFTGREIRAMAPGPEAVFRCWTLKEAYLKFIEKGFNESLHHVEILGTRVLHKGKEQPVACRSWILDEGYALGLVTGSTG